MANIRRRWARPGGVTSRLRRLRAMLPIVAVVAVAVAAPVSAGNAAVLDGGQHGTDGYDGHFAVAADGSGTYLAGERRWFDGNTNDLAHLRQILPNGADGWIHNLGTGGYDYYLDVVTTADAVYAVGGTSGDIAHPGQSKGASYDAFIEKLRKSDGARVWVRQFGGDATSQEALGVAVDETGVYVSGQTANALAGCLPIQCQHAGSNDPFLRKYSFAGSQLWTRQYGSVMHDDGDGVAVHGGSVYVGGITYGIVQAGHVPTGGNSAYVRRFTPNGATTWTRQFGPVSDEFLSFGQLDANAHGVYIAGSTAARLGGTTYDHQGMDDVYVRMYAPGGALRDTRQFGGAGEDEANGLATLGSAVVVGGETTGNLFGANQGGDDAWARRYTSAATGPLVPAWQLHLGTAQDDIVWALDAVARGTYVGGHTDGAMTGCSPACQNQGDFDAFWLQLD